MKTVRSNPTEPSADSPRGVRCSGQSPELSLSIGQRTSFPKDPELGLELCIFRGCLGACRRAKVHARIYVHVSRPEEMAGCGPRAPSRPLRQPGAFGQVLGEISLQLTYGSLAGTQRGQLNNGSWGESTVCAQAAHRAPPAQPTLHPSRLCVSQNTDLPTPTLLRSPVGTHRSVQEPHLASDTHSLPLPSSLDPSSLAQHQHLYPHWVRIYFFLPLDPKQIGGASPQGRRQSMKQRKGKL